MTSPPAAPRIVAAVSDDVQRRIRAVLPECELRFVHTGSQLVRVLDEAHCDMMIVEMHFDGSTAVAALKCVLSRDETFPVVCVRGVPFAKLGRPALDALRMALGELSAQIFIDLLQYSDDDAGNARTCDARAASARTKDECCGWTAGSSWRAGATPAAMSSTNATISSVTPTIHRSERSAPPTLASVCPARH